MLTYAKKKDSKRPRYSDSMTYFRVTIFRGFGPKFKVYKKKKVMWSHRLVNKKFSGSRNVQRVSERLDKDCFFFKIFSPVRLHIYSTLLSWVHYQGVTMIIITT